jgi:hypothetical protein
LRADLELQFSAEELALELDILSDVRGDHALDLSVAEEHS